MIPPSVISCLVAWILYNKTAKHVTSYWLELKPVKHDELYWIWQTIQILDKQYIHIIFVKGKK